MPAGTALFGNTTTGPGSTGGNKHLVEVRAGKMTLKSRTVYPDKRKGLLYIYQSEDSLMHFCWQDRTTGMVEDDLIIFPDDCEYVRVPQCTTGRAYLLRFKSSNRKFFFWLQEPRTDKDDENCKRINELLNNPSSAVQSTHSPDQDLQSLLNNMSQSQLMQLFGGAQMGGLSNLLGTMRGPGGGGGSARTTTPALTHRTAAPTATTTSTTTATPAAAATAVAPSSDAAKAASAPKSANDPIQLADLQNFLQNIAPDATTSTTIGAAGAGQSQQNVDLSTALTGDTLAGILNNPGALQLLQSHLPATEGGGGGGGGAGNVQEALRSTLASPQFQQAVSQFSSALESGQLAPVVSQLAVDPAAVAAAAQGNMAEFVKALEKSAGVKKDGDEKIGAESDKAKSEDEGKKKKKKGGDGDDDEEMQLD